MAKEAAEKPLEHSNAETVKARHTEFLFAATGVLVTILALVFWGFLFVFAWGLYAVGVYKAPWFSRDQDHARIAKKGIIDALIALALVALWWFAPIPDFAKPKEGKSTLVSASPIVANEPIQTATPSSTQTNTIQATPLSTPLRSPAPTGDNPLLSFDRTILIKGGSVHRLDALMTAAGYKGSLLLQTLYIYNKDESGAEICWGDQPNVDPTTGGCVPSGDGYNFPGGRDARQVYLMAKKDMRLYISALSR